jgi:hypothetical protein
MIKLRLFFKNIRNAWFVGRLEREIYNRIAPHIHGLKDGDYPFSSREELLKAAVEGNLDTKFLIESIEREAERMPEAYGEAFRYVMYRDLNTRLRQYARLAQRRVYPTTCDPRFVATRA